MKIILKYIIHNFLCILSFFIPQKNIIIIGGPDNRRYGGNVKYLYEFLSENTSYEVFWLTESEDIMKHLQSKNLRYLTNKNYLKKIITTLKCKYVIDSGTNFYNPFNFVSKMKKIIIVTGGAGFVGSNCPKPLHCKLHRKKRIQAVGTPV